MPEQRINAVQKANNHLCETRVNRKANARVSTREQNPEAQTDVLESAGCEKIFVEHASGVLTRRPVLDEALGYLRSGDTLVVAKLDRLGRSVRNLKEVADTLQRRNIGLKALSQGIDTTTPGGRLFFHMLAAIAEFEHDLIVERTQDGLAAARARGRKGGGRLKMSPTKAAQARAMYDARQHTVAQIAETFGVSRGTIYRHLTQHVEHS
ncbi:recombinase family protein [Arthrobacter sp. GN70]|uniref:Recombinase family protein n=2 Tax=Arthrobacter TaxID=1663 RepID=A0A4R5K081_9MICC|nr:recombinase family protein [Arthrobacter sp. GN70]TDF83604.1 recombinase family protein [Arthrobacter terricola]